MKPTMDEDGGIIIPDHLMPELRQAMECSVFYGMNDPRNIYKNESKKSDPEIKHD